MMLRLMPATVFAQLSNTGATIGQHSALRAASPEAAHIERLYWFIFWICFGVFVLMIGALSRTAVRNRASDTEMLPIIQDEQGDRRAAWGVAIAVGLTTVILFIILASSVVIGSEVEPIPPKEAVTIDITGHQWWWEIKYPNSEADLSITTANEIHVPVGSPVNVLTHSQDVIHSFWAPSINGKRDLIPGYSSALSFRIDTPGIYRGQCAEFCGLQHAHMGFSIVAESSEAFVQWERDQLRSAHNPDNPEESRGQQVFLSHPCILCHTIRGTNAGSNVGPDLTHIASQQMIAAETLPNTPGALAGWIIDPQRIKPGTQMPPNPMDPDDLQALLAYLESLR
jgi:cytochrome c oxidase subunit II